MLASTKSGINVIQQNLEDGLRLFEDASFDFAILSQTLQTIHQTAAILRETVRVGKECIVSFPNFGYWPHRLSVLRGRMPVSKSLPYQWHNTPNVRVLTIKDFERSRRKWASKFSTAWCCTAARRCVGARTGVVVLRSIASGKADRAAATGAGRRESSSIR